MSTIETTVAASPAIQELLETRLSLIAAVEACNEQLAAVAGRKDAESVATRNREGGRKATLTHKISKVELELAMEGAETTPYKAAQVGVKKGDTGISEDELKANLAKVAKVYSTTQYESVKATADQRIQALLKSAEKRGFKVTDPRK